jgi:hypothetical protein
MQYSRYPKHSHRKQSLISVACLELNCYGWPVGKIDEKSERRIYEFDMITSWTPLVLYSWRSMYLGNPTLGCFEAPIDLEKASPGLCGTLSKIDTY